MSTINTNTSLVLAAAVLLSGAAVASAATMQPRAADTLSLSVSQQRTAWRDLDTPTLNQSAPSGFDAAVGAVVPSKLTVAAMPSRAARDVPALRPYGFAMVQHKVVIVNPADHKIADVITG